MDTMDDALKLVKTTIFKLSLEPKEVVQPDGSRKLSWALECYNVQTEGDEDDPRTINIPESEGSQEVCDLEIKYPNVAAPLKTKQVNIGTE